MKEEPVKIEQLDDGDEKHMHPAFGMIRVGHISGDASLVGSSVRHQHFVSIEISEAVKYKTGSYHERFMPIKTLCNVYLSHAQLSEMLFNSNTSGVPCTIRQVIGESKLRPSAPYESPMKKNRNDMSDVLRNTLSKARELAAEAEKLFDMKSPKKADRQRAKFLAMKIVQDIDSNLPFAMTCMDEKLENNIAHAKAEIESFVDMTFRKAGIEHLKQEAGLSLLEGDTGMETD